MCYGFHSPKAFFTLALASQRALVLIPVLMHIYNVCLNCEQHSKFQIPASNNVGGVAETGTVLQSVTDICMYSYICTLIWTRAKR